MAGAENAVTSREAAIEILALNVFGIADAAGRQVTRQLVESRLTELAGHPQGCGCGLCDLVGLVTVSKVHGVAVSWYRQIAATRALARGSRARPKRRMAR